jgi:hypothetical protein
MLPPAHGSHALLHLTVELCVLDSEVVACNFIASQPLGSEGRKCKEVEEM